MANFDMGVELGRIIERQHSTDSAVSEIKTEVKAIRSDVAEVKTFVVRGGILISLWGSALVLIMGHQEKAEFIAGLIQSVLGKK